MKLYLASDHAGFELKNKISAYLEDELGFEVVDLGAHQFDKDDDYPEIMRRAAEEVSRAPEEARAFLFGGSGQGEAVVANRLASVRAAVFYGACPPKESVNIEGEQTEDPYAIVRLSREHNNANVLAIGARFVDEATAKEAVKVWLETPFSSAERHKRRVDDIGPAQ